MADDAYQLIIGGVLCNQPVENVLHWKNTGVTSGANPQTAAAHLIAAFQGAIEAAWLDVLPPNYDLIGYKCKRINNGGGPTIVELSAGGTVGTLGTNANESAIAPCLILSYSNGVRFFAGRIFLPGIGDDQIDDNAFAAGYLTAVGTLNGLWNTPLANGGDTFDFGVWSQTHGQLYQAVAIHLSMKVGVQRRRLVPTF